MNTQQSPLIPQGSLMEQKNKGRARVKIAVFFVLAVHGIGLMALLMQGCRREEAPPATPLETPTNTEIPSFEATNQVVAATNETPMVPPTVTNQVPVVEPTPAVPAVTPSTTEYAIAKGDTFSSIAKKFHVTTKALQDANPGVEPTKLKIGQKIQVPAPSAPSPSAVLTPGVEAAPSGPTVYTVKSGDTLSRIATQFKVSVRVIRAANNLKTDSIKVGQKLKIPVKAPAPTPAPAIPSATEPAPTTPSTAPITQ